MCRNIKPLFNYEPPASADEVRARALQFVRKVSGSTRPSQANQAAFDLAVDQVTQAVEVMLANMTTQAAPRDREREVAKARQRSLARFGHRA